MKTNITVVGPRELHKLLRHTAKSLIREIKYDNLLKARLRHGHIKEYSIEGLSTINVKACIDTFVPTITYESPELVTLLLPGPGPGKSGVLGTDSEVEDWFNLAAKHSGSDESDKLIEDIFSNQLSVQAAAKVFGISELKLQQNLLKAAIYQFSPDGNSFLAEYQFLWPAFSHFGFSDMDKDELYIDIQAYIAWTLRASIFDNS